MKSKLVLLFVILLAIPAFSQSKAAQIADIKDTISTLEQGYAPLQDRLKANEKFGDEISFAGKAYDKAHEQFKTDLANFNTEQDSVNRGFELLKPSWENYQQRKAQHDANRCTAPQGSNTCDWYNQEADSIDAQRNQIVAIKQPLDQRQATLGPQRTSLQQTQQQLQEIYQNQVTNYNKWKAEQDSVKSSYLELKAKIASLNKQLAILYGSVNNCMAEVRAVDECEKPAVGPDGKPILNQNCERMKAACNSMFDGSK